MLFYLSQRKSFRDDPANFRLSITNKTRSDLTTSLLMIPKVSGCDQGWRLKEDRKVWREEKNKVVRNFLSRLSPPATNTATLPEYLTDKTRCLADEMFVQVMLG